MSLGCQRLDDVEFPRERIELRVYPRSVRRLSVEGTGITVEDDGGVGYHSLRDERKVLGSALCEFDR